VFPLPISNSSLQISHSSHLIIHPFARGAAKSLSPAAVRALATLLAPIPVTLVGIGPAIADLPPNVTDLTNRTTLPELITLLHDASAVISVDSGPMHLAAALDVPLLAIHTWSDPQKVGPYRETAWIHQGGQLRQQSLATPAPAQRPITQCHLQAIADWVHTVTDGSPTSQISPANCSGSL
jgi:ADP-heptose:LPS heptosyltransferase